MTRVMLPRSLDECWANMEAWPEASVYAGGTDLLVRLRRGGAEPGALVCLERIEELGTIEEQAGGMFLGACATHARLLEHLLVRRHLPVLALALAELGSPLVRNMGTIGGNLVTASPAGDTLPALYVLEAQVEVRSRRGQRRLPVDRFISGPGRVDLAPGELVSGIWVEKAERFNLPHFEKVGQRRALAIAVASLAAMLELSVEGVVKRVRLAWGSVGPTIVTSPRAEQALTGRTLSHESLEEAAHHARQAMKPISDLRASAAYRRQVAGNLLLRLKARASV